MVTLLMLIPPPPPPVRPDLPPEYVAECRVLTRQRAASSVTVTISGQGSARRMAVRFARSTVGGLPRELSQATGPAVSLIYGEGLFETLDAADVAVGGSRLRLWLSTGQQPSSGAQFRIEAESTPVPLAVGLCDRRDRHSGQAS